MRLQVFLWQVAGLLVSVVLPQSWAATAGAQPAVKPAVAVPAAKAKTASPAPGGVAAPPAAPAAAAAPAMADTVMKAGVSYQIGPAPSWVAVVESPAQAPAVDPAPMHYRVIDEQLR